MLDFVCVPYITTIGRAQLCYVFLALDLVKGLGFAGALPSPV